MPCDGTIQDYRRHSYRGEEPCPESREAWRRARRFYRHTGVYEDRDPEKVHPFFYRKPKKGQTKRDGRYFGHNKSKTKGRS